MYDKTDDAQTGHERSSESAGTGRRSEEPALIRAEIDDTRSRLSDTLDELGERLNPHVVKERIKDGIREATIGRVEHMARNAADRVNDTGRNIADTIRENPIPAAVAGIALGWLFFNGRRSAAPTNGRGSGAPGRRAYEPYQNFERYNSERRSLDDAYFSDSEPGMVERVRERAGEIAETVKEKAGEVTDRVTDRAQQAAGKVSQKAHDVADRVSGKAHDVASTVADRSRQGARRVEDMYYENPLALGAITLAAGFAIAIGAPATETETELVGEARDHLVDKVRTVAREKTELAQHVAERVIDEGKRVAKEAAREEGLVRG